MTQEMDKRRKKSRIRVRNIWYAFADTVLGLAEWRSLNYECKVAYILRALSMVLASGISSLLFNICFMNDGNSLALSYILFNLYLVPLVYITCMYGLLGGLMTFSLTFVECLIMTREDAYLLTFNLVAVFLIAALKDKRHTGTVKKSLISGIKAAVILSLVYSFVFLIIGHGAFYGVKLDAVLVHMGMVVPQAFVDVMFIYVLQNCFPKSLNPFFNRFDAEHRSSLALWAKERGNNDSISGKLFVIFGVEALLLGIFAALFANSLIPGLRQQTGNMVAEQYGGNYGQGEDAVNNQVSAGTEEMMRAIDDIRANHPFNDFAEDVGIDDTFNLAGRIENVERFRYDNAGLAFDLKLILLIIDIITPIVLVANYLGQKIIVRPIISMTQAMDAFTANTSDEKERKISAGRLKRLSLKTGDEIERLYDSLVATTEEITAYLNRVTEEQQLREDLRVAKASSEAKSNFLSNVSHEIRTPINAVLGLDEMILRESDDKAILKYAADIKNSGKSLLGLVNDLLDFSKIEAGKMEIIPVEYELSSVINDLINMVAVKAADKGLKLDIDIDETTPHILYGDEIRIKQCVLNILNNAVKYTHEGSVTLKITYKGSAEQGDSVDITFRVIDTGIGIKEEDIEKLYSPFERIEESRNRTIEGTGLGMSIVKQLLDLMGSRLVVKSVYGEGSDFSFTVAQKVVNWEEIGDFNETYQRSLNEADSYRVSFVAPDARILVVDDTPMNLTVVRGLLKATLLSVDTATSGREALDKVKDTEYDMIFLDQRMPEMDGIQTLAAMRELADNKSADAPVIALTANAVSGARESFMAAGFDDYVSKPIDAVRLEKLLSTGLPWEKVYMPGSADYERLTGTDANITKTDKNTADDESGDKSMTDILKSIEGIDYDAGVTNCSSEDILLAAIGDFKLALKTGPDEIERYRQKRDIRNYTIKVHALKSSARLIGAMELSEQARYLEKCGDDNNIEEIDALTPKLLSLYRSYEDRLKVLDTDDEDGDKPVIDSSQMADGYAALREAAEAFDFDTADAIIEMLNEYAFPDGEKERFGRIKDAVRAVERDELLELLED